MARVLELAAHSPFSAFCIHKDCLTFAFPFINLYAVLFIVREGFHKNTEGVFAICNKFVAIKKAHKEPFLLLGGETTSLLKAWDTSSKD